MTIHSTIGLREKIGFCLATFMAVAKSCVEKIIRLDAQLCTWNRPPYYITYSKMERVDYTTLFPFSYLSPFQNGNGTDQTYEDFSKVANATPLRSQCVLLST